jgi:hypothetical protein
VSRRYWPAKRDWSTISTKAIVTAKNCPAHDRGTRSTAAASPSSGAATAGGEADIAAAKAIKADIATVYAGNGLK